MGMLTLLAAYIAQDIRSSLSKENIAPSIPRKRIVYQVLQLLKEALEKSALLNK
jgi:hypothetical protein